MIDLLSKKISLLLLLSFSGFLSCRSVSEMQKDLVQHAKENSNAVMDLHKTTLETSKGFYTSPLGFLYALCFLWVTYLIVKLLFTSLKGTN